MTEQRLPSINGLRAISILIVIFCHLGTQYNFFYNRKFHEWTIPFIGVFANGQLGVNVFFVISGFLITSLLLNEENKTGTISLKKFYIRRTIRIFPAYYFMLLFYFILQLAGVIHLSALSWLTSITYTKYIYASDWYTGHAWSLSVEEHFYLLWPLIFMSGKRLRIYVASFLILIIPFIRIFIHFHPVWWMAELSIFTRADAISIGCLVAIYKDRLVEILSDHLNFIFITAASVLFLWNGVFSLLVQHGLHTGVIYGPLGVGDGIISNICISAILLYCVYGGKGLVFKFLNSPILNYIGLLSYSLYLWQEFFIYKTNMWFNQYPFCLIYLVVCALLSYYIVEKPFLKLKSRFKWDNHQKKEIMTVETDPVIH